jgi:DNA integrity scanning protein DisA with diadenylate cyclase activity
MPREQNKIQNITLIYFCLKNYVTNFVSKKIRNIRKNNIHLHNKWNIDVIITCMWNLRRTLCKNVTAMIHIIHCIYVFKWTHIYFNKNSIQRQYKNKCRLFSVTDFLYAHHAVKDLIHNLSEM